MLKMSGSCKYHCHFVCVAIIDAQTVLNGSPGLDNGFYSGTIRNFHTIREREKRITGHHCSLKVKIKRLCLVYCLFQGIYSARLPGTTGKKLSFFYQYNGVALCVLTDFGCKQ